MTHAEFIAAYRAGRLTVEFDAVLSGKFLSARLLLPLMILPLLGAGVALALLGWIWSGLVVIALGIVAPRLIKRGAPRFLLTQMLNDEKLYVDAQRAGILRLETPDPQNAEAAGP